MSAPVDRRTVLAASGSSTLALWSAGAACATPPTEAPRAGAIMDVPVAVDFARVHVPDSVTMIRTGGHHIPGLGGALYVANASRAGDLPALQSANGRRFVLCEDELRAIRPEVLGAEGNCTVTVDGGSARFTGADDSAAIGEAMRIAMQLTGCVVLSARKYRLGNALPPITCAMALVGAGSLKTWLMFDPGASGDAISMVETWLGKDPTEIGPHAAVVAMPQGQSTGVTLGGFTLSGSRSALRPQNGIVLYERNDNLFISDVEVRHIKGRGFASGLSRRSPPVSLLRESRIDRLQVRRCGNAGAGLPAFELSSDGYRPADDASNNLSITDLLVIYSAGRAVVLENRNAHQDMRYIAITGMFVEGASEDLVTVRGSIANLDIRGMDLNGSRGENIAALRFSASPQDAVPRPPRMCIIAGALGPVTTGIVVDQGKDLQFSITQNGAQSVHMRVGAGCTGAVLCDGPGVRNWRWDIAPTVQPYVAVAPLRRVWSLSTLPAASTMPNATVVLRDGGDGKPALAFCDGHRWHMVAMEPVAVAAAGAGIKAP
ncbi:hypothetical protein [Novosphingobium lentum]|uniref:hypothetical protein n=1 Tax=Novosphingobium lentum TaxID=145287 RepID=UPI00082B0D6D|nr:hypothetical protein [Novosphingobium lentum]